MPRDDEHSLSSVGTAKIVGSYGPRKLKLQQITLQQWVIANTRIFYTLFAGSKLPSVADLQHYLAYTVKIMELSLKHLWISVLRYDGKFRQLQGVYNYPWSFDSNHLHSVLLEPISTQLGDKTKQTWGRGGG